MSERGIIMQAESVRAILAGRKTQTRRVVKPQPYSGAEPIGRAASQFGGRKSGFGWAFRIPDGSKTGQACWAPWAPGDRLWVREAWRECETFPDGERAVAYAATDESPRYPQGYVAKWRNPRFMPRWASRLTLEVVEVRVQRVQEISEDDALAEGVRPDYRPAFERAWDDLNAKRGFPWASNPWVWAVTFKRVEAV